MIIIQKKEVPSQKVMMDQSYLIPTDLIENKDSYHLIMDLPGVNKQAITITYEDNILSVEASLEKSENVVYLLEERTATKWQRAFELEEVDSNKITASYEQGVLTIQAMKIVQPEIQKKQIEIN